MTTENYAVVEAKTKEELEYKLEVLKSQGRITEVLSQECERDPRYLKKANRFHWVAKVR